MQTSGEVVASALANGAIGVLPHYMLRAQAEVGQFADALRNGESAMRHVNTVGDPFAISVVCVGLGYAYVRRGMASGAIPPLERSINLCRQYGIDIQIPWTASTLGLAYALAGRHAEAIASAEEAVEHAAARGITRYQALRVSLLSNVYLLAGRRDDAYASAKEALELAQRYREAGPEAWALYLRAASQEASASDAAGDARSTYLDALRRAEALAMRPLCAHCHLGLGQTHLALGATRSEER